MLKPTKAAWVRVGWSLVTFAMVLTATIVAVSALSTQGRISLVQGIALFAVALILWMAAVTLMWDRWWQHRCRGEAHDRADHDDRAPVPFT